MSKQNQNIRDSEKIKKKSRQNVLSNDFLDIFLFFIGLLIPFIFGDLIESLVGGIFDLFLFSWFLRQGKSFKQTTGILILESLDLTDFFTLGLIDFLGWIEIIPFWYLFFTYFVREEEKKDFMEKINISSTNVTEDGKTIQKISTCPYCGAEMSANQVICEHCGKELLKGRGDKNQINPSQELQD